MSSLQAVQVIQTPIGEVAVGATDQGISDVEILTPEKTRTGFSGSTLASSHAERAATQLNEYFQGKRTTFDLPLDLQGTAFQVAVWNQIASIGFGKQVSYGQIGAKLGKPQAARAVGGAVGANPVPLIVGCHRVMGSSGKVTGYSGGQGIKTKLWLLEHEGIDYR
jgi:methylated-DNA-[protein]-cysteine S-methyltransferase